MNSSWNWDRCDWTEIGLMGVDGSGPSDRSKITFDSLCSYLSISLLNYFAFAIILFLSSTHLCFSFGLWLFYLPLSRLAVSLFNPFVLLHLCSYALVRFELAASGEWELWSIWKWRWRKRYNSQHLCFVYR